MSRDKGQRGEREVSDIIKEIITKVSPELVGAVKRNTCQSDGGGFDLVGTPGLAVEVKHTESENWEAWWKQAKTQANTWNIEHQDCVQPVVFWRKNRAKWVIMLWLPMPIPPCGRYQKQPSFDFKAIKDDHPYTDSENAEKATTLKASFEKLPYALDYRWQINGSTMVWAPAKVNLAAFEEWYAGMLTAMRKP